MVCPSSDICPWPSTSMEQDDIVPLNPPLGTVMWNDTVEPLTVPCIDPFPVMLRLVSLMFIVPVMALPFWVRAHVMFSRPVVSADMPIHVPDRLVSVATAVGVGAVGMDADPAHALTNTKLKTTRRDLRISRSLLGLRGIVKVGCPTRHYNRFTEPTCGDTGSEPLLECDDRGPRRGILIASIAAAEALQPQAEPRWRP